ncbi:cytochrome P450 2A10 [Caerostris extrusa]|uniref:Cytochrome P450 2A10 n=1 Tax=Caerostris extrusa TaxID=172846 RepID=A0AAV4MD40_CAEEX|nr:cytochrome P450 2A10 [Caerostris extrusa]
MALDQYLSVPLLITTGVLVFTWFLWHLWSKNRKLPPGPWGVPVLGYYPFLSATPGNDFMELSKKYGKVFSFRTLGGKLFVVLNESSVLKEVLINRSDEFERPHGSTLITWVSNGVGITQEDGEIWKEQRRFFLQSAKNFGFGKLELETRIHEEVKGMVEDLRKTGGGDADVQFHVAYANNSIISHVLFTKKFAKDYFYRELLTYFVNIVKLFVGKKHVLVGPMLNVVLLMSPVLRQAKKAKDFFWKLTNEQVKEHVDTFDPTHVRDYVDEYLLQRRAMMKNGNVGSFTIERLQANCVNLFLEGTESVSFTINLLLTELSKHPDVQKKIQQELDVQVGRERFPSWAERTKLPFLEATIQELYRMASPFLISTMYSNPKETKIAGFTVPASSIIVFNLGPMHFDPTHFPDPHRFDPSRFLDASGKKVKKEGPYPFGVGRRSCIGESLAQMEVFIMIGSIVQNFTVYPGKAEETLRVVPRD